MTWNTISVALLVLLTIALTIILYCNFINTKKKLEQLQRCHIIKIGMSENEMLLIMGEGYSKSLLKNNRKKYEWRINATRYGTSYSGVKKVDIYIKNGFVEEVRPHNV